MDDNPKKYPQLPPCTLERSPRPLQLQRKWSLPFPEAVGLCVGDWNSDGAPEILVSDKSNTIHILNLEGNEIGSFQTPQEAELMEIGRTQEGPVLVVYKNWGKRVVAFDRDGEILWRYPRKLQLKWGIDGANWGDIDGDGNDELVIGFNGLAGLCVLNHLGKILWRNRRYFGVWNQCAVPAKLDQRGRVFVSEGMIHMLDSRGKKVAEFRSIGDYYVSPISAGVIDEEGTIQIGAIGTYKSESREEFDGWFCGMIFGLDSTGEVVWRTPAWTHHGAWRTPQFGLGDLDGDGRKEWAFMRDFYELVVCNQDGVRIATLDLQRRPDRFAIVSRNENGKEQGLIVLKDEIGVECWGPMSPQYLNEFEESVSEEGLDPNALEPDLVSA